MSLRLLSTLSFALGCGLFGSCGETGTAPSPSVRPSNTGGIEIVPIRGWLWSNAERTGLDTAASIDLASGASKDEERTIWHSYGIQPNVAEVAWNLVNTGSIGDRYSFQVRTYNAQGQPNAPTQIDVLYTGKTMELWEVSSNRFELRYDLPIEGQ